MKTSVLAGLGALVFLSVSACDRMDPDIRIRRSDTFLREGRPGRTGMAGQDSSGAVVIPPDGLFVTAVAYPEGYDWRRDTAHGSVRGRVLLLRARERAAFDTLLSLEAGPGKAVSLDPDRHHFAGGHLYTECFTESGTVYRRDGQTVLRVSEREYVRGILSLDGDLYVLSQRLSGEGFLLRRNWKPLLSYEEGRLHGSLGDMAFGRTGALFEDSGQACFFFQDPDGGWHLVRGKEEEKVVLPKRVANVYDIRCLDGTVCLVCRTTGKHAPVLYVGNKKYDLTATVTAPSQLGSFSLFRYGDEVGFRGTFRLNWNQALYTGRWTRSRLVESFPGTCFWLEDGSYVLKQDGKVVAARHRTMEYSLPESGLLTMPQCVCISPGALYLALTPPGRGTGTAERPWLWADGERTEIGLNGCLTSVTFLP